MNKPNSENRLKFGILHKKYSNFLQEQLEYLERNFK